MLKFATPVSHLFEKEDDAERIIAHSDCLEGRPRTLAMNYPGQMLFHCDEIQPIHEMRDDEFAYIERVKRLKSELKLITFHCASTCDAPELGLGGRVWIENGGRIYTAEEMKENVRRNIPKMKDILGPDIMIGIENNNYYPTPAYQWVTDPDFVATIVRENDIHLLLDIAHAELTVFNAKQMDFETYLSRLPMERIKQIHISRQVIDPALGWMMDAHEYPTDPTWSRLQSILKRWSAEYLTVEYYKDTNQLVASLKFLRTLV